MPSTVRNFTDFLTSSFHFGRLRPDGQLSRTFMGIPIAYHSRASSVRQSGDVVRPHAISKRDGELGFAPSIQMDYELAVGIWVGPGNAFVDPIRIEVAADRIFGFCLLKDWSVRNAQWFESRPLGPFLAMSVSTTVSSWVVAEEALRPFRTGAFRRDEADLKPMPHLLHPRGQAEGGLDLELTASILTPEMQVRGLPPEVLTRTNARHLYWTFAQMLAHHSSNGCNMLPGDLLGSVTVSGPIDESRACLAEINGRGTSSISLSNGEQRLQPQTSGLCFWSAGRRQGRGRPGPSENEFHFESRGRCRAACARPGSDEALARIPASSAFRLPFRDPETPSAGQPRGSIRTLHCVVRCLSASNATGAALSGTTSDTRFCGA